MTMKVVDATVSDLNADQLRSELQNNKPNFILFLATTSLSLCPGDEASSYCSKGLTRIFSIHKCSMFGIILLSLHTWIIGSRTFGMEMGISKDMLNPLALKTFTLAFIFLIGPWLGFWVVHKYVHHDDGLVDSTVSLFVSWSIRVLATFLILQCSLDPLLATGVLICGILTSSMLRKIFKFRFRRRLYRKLFKPPNKPPKISDMLDMPCSDAYDDEPRINISQSNNLSCSSFGVLDGDVYPSIFHSHLNRENFQRMSGKISPRTQLKRLWKD